MVTSSRFSVTTGVPVNFCDPRSPWQRGTNENTNGLLRQYFPKRSDLAPFSQHDLDLIAECLSRPFVELGGACVADSDAEDATLQELVALADWAAGALDKTVPPGSSRGLTRRRAAASTTRRKTI